MSKAKKIRLVIIGIVLAAVVGYGLHLCLNYFFYNAYRQYLKGYTYEEGTPFSPLEDQGKHVPGMVLAAENDYLKLYTNPETTEIAVYDKRSGQLTYSNPPDRSEDAIATGRNKSALSSQFTLTYYDITMTEATMNNYEFSVERGQFEIEKLKDGIRYVYLLGDLTNPTGIVPPVISPERLEEKVLSRLEDKDAKTIKSSYMESESYPGFLELTAGIRVSKVGLQKLNKLFEKAGYTIADFDEDAALVSGGEAQERTTFTIPLEYRLVGQHLEVSIPTGQIIETGSGKLAAIDLLCFLSAGGVNEDGYLFVPNGSGSLIYFNNGKSNEKYNQYVYGLDECTPSFTVVEETEKIRLPVFGIKKGDRAVFAEITGGETLANIIARVSGSINSYNYVYPSFSVRGYERVSVFGTTGVSADLPTLEKDLYKLELKVSYSFLGPEEASYSGMANHYRDELIERGILTARKEEGDIPFYLDLLGGVKIQKSILGVNYMGVHAMTRFDQAQKIVEAFNSQGISALRVNYLGWFNGGYYHDVPIKIKVESVLGGKKALYSLDKRLKDMGGRLYGDVAIQRVTYEAEGIHYNWRLENSQYYSGLSVAMGRVNPATLRIGPMNYYETMYNVLSPKFLVRHVDRFLKGMEKVELKAVSLRDMGDMVASDKRRSQIINRQESKQIVLAQMDKIKQSMDHLMIQGGYDYAWAYASDLVNVPMGHNPFYIVDEEIPFYQMVLHGCIDYTGKALNLSSRYDEADILLELIETGASPHFLLTYENSSDMKYSGLNYMYSTYYETWLKQAVELYHKANEVLKHTRGSLMVDHRILAEGVRCITYENGCVLYINTNHEEVSLGGRTLPARGYVLEGIAQ